MTSRRRSLGVVAAVLLATAALVQPHAAAEPGQQSPGEAYAAMGFGVFMHYGLATFVGQTPWNYDPHDVEPTVYDPSDFDPDQWMDAIAASGAEYIILTTKHHDGFVMWPSEYTDYGVASSSDPDTDVVGEVVQAARDHGLEVALYYSWYDKLHPGGDVLSGPPTEDYVQYAKNHLRELLTSYGPITAVWMDTPLHAREAEMSEFVHTVSPDTAFIWKYIVQGRQLPAYDDTDVRTFEGLGQRERRIDQLGTCDFGEPAEVAYNVSAGLGWWQMSDAAPPTVDVDRVVSELTYTNALGATLSLNVSPGPSGRIPPDGVRLLEAVGNRLRGDNVLVDTTTTASSEVGEHPAGHATDLLASTSWQPGDANAWLQVDLGQPVTINQTAVQFTGEDAVSGYEIQYQDAKGRWRTAAGGDAPTYPTQTDELSGVTTSSLRLVVDGAMDGAGVVEFKAYGGLDDAADTVIYDGTWQGLAAPEEATDAAHVPAPMAGAFNDTVHRSRESGATAKFAFTGNGVALHTSTGADQGIVSVSVDGGEPQLVDLYRTDAGRDEVVYQRDDLDPGEHTLTVEVTGELNDDARGAWATVDRITPLNPPAPFDPGEPFEVMPDGRLIYDDVGATCGDGSPIRYSGRWTAGSWDGAHNDTRHYSNSAGAYAEMSFEGTGVAVMTQTRPGHGIAAISVDGGEPELVDTYSDPPEEQVVVWEKTGLEPGEHTIRIEVTGDSNPAAINSWVALDALILTP